MVDPRKAKTLDEACANGDGTYNGARLLSWLSEAANPGKGVPEAEVRKMWDRAKAARAAVAGAEARQVDSP
jgi:hypothetical protein